MPLADQHQSAEYVKLLGIGDSGTGKTGSLCSLVKAGYKLRILDFDNGLDPLVAQVRQQCPERLSAIHFISEGLRDKFKPGPSGSMLPDGQVRAFTKAISLLDKWVELDATGKPILDYGAPRTWGPDTILVLDTLTFLSDAAFNWATAMNPGAKDPRQWYKTAQDAVSHMLGLLSSADFKTNVIVFAHVKYMDRPDGSVKGYPTSVGSALSPEIPAYFNSVALYQTVVGGRRTIRTQATALIDLKNPASFKMAPEFDLNEGLVKFFETLKGPLPKEVSAKP